MNDTHASAEATKAIAETAGKALDIANNLGGFFSRVLGPAAEEAGAMLHDTIKFHRAMRLQRLQQRFNEIRNQQNLHGSIVPLDFKVGIPLLEAAALESNDELQDMFAHLLVNGTSYERPIVINRTFVSIVQDFGSLEAKLLAALCNAPARRDGVGIRTAGLPEKYLDNGEDEMKLLPSREVELALWNLCRLGCISASGTWGGGSTILSVSVSALGRALFEACT